MPTVPGCATKVVGLSTSVMLSVPPVLSTALVSVRLTTAGVMTAASFTAVMLSGIVVVACSSATPPVKPGSIPVLPLSLMLTVKLTVPLALSAVW